MISFPHQRWLTSGGMVSYTVKQTEKVEPMTLKAFVKEQIQNGKNVPSDVFGVYVASKTKLTTKEE